MSNDSFGKNTLEYPNTKYTVLGVHSLPYSYFMDKQRNYMPSIATQIFPISLPSDFSANDLLHVLEYVDCGIVVHTKNQQIVYCNKKAAAFLSFETQKKMTKYFTNSQNFIDTDTFDVFDEMLQPICIKDLPWEKVFCPKKSPATTIILKNKNNSQMKRLHIQSTLLHKHVPEIIITVITDVSIVALLEKQKDDFMNMASHELKTPITSMKVFTQLLEKAFDTTNDAKPLYYLGKIESQLNKLTLLVKEILDVSKLQSGRMQFRKEYFSIDDLVKDAAEQMQLTTDTHTIVVQAHINRQVFADRERIGQVIINLLSNAIKYSPQHSKIYVKGYITKGNVVIEVIDHGIGISKKDKKNIFDRFAKGDGEFQNTFPGMGVGLYIASEILKRHNGNIEVESEKKKGSTFRFSLPVTTHE